MAEKNVLTWLHLSDFHFKAPPRKGRRSPSWRQDKVMDALADQLPGLLGEASLKPDLAFVTGDIAQSGQAAEYHAAQAYFETLGQTLGLDPKTRWFVVPGNHDVSRARVIGGLNEYLRENLTETRAGDFLDRRGAWGQFADRQKAYLGFTKSFLGGARAWKAAEPWKTEIHAHGKYKIAVLCLNTAWASQDDADRDKIMLGERQVNAALNDAKGADLKIALMHHPLKDLAEFDEVACGKLLKSPQGCQFILHGHLHRTNLDLVQSPSARRLELAAGACWEKEEAKNPYAFSAVKLDLETGKGAIYVWSYADDDGGIWSPDNKLYQGMKHGRWDFALTSPPRPEGARLKKQEGIADEDWIPAAYRDCLVAELRDLEPLLAADQKIRFRLKDVYEPAETDWLEPERKKQTEARATKRGGAKAANMEEAALPARRPLADLLTAPDHRHFVVAGEPGGGKSTFVNYTTLAMLRQRSGPLPIRLELKKLGAWLKGRQGEQGALLLAWAGERLGELGLDEAGLLARSGQGRLLWLLDGLDEIFDPGLRARAARVIGAWFGHGPGRADRALVTTRPHALDDPKVGAALKLDKNRADILALDEAAQRRFLDKWFMAVYEGAAGKAARHRDRLWTGLARHRELEKMKKTPLLLSMIAAVYQQGHRLPERRAALYGKAIDDLIQRRFGPHAPEGSEALALRAWHALAAVARGMTEAGQAREDGEAGFGARDFQACLEAGFHRDRPELERRIELEDLARKLAGHSGLLRLHGNPVRYGFAHLGFQEYLTAWAYGNERNPIDALEPRLDDGAWREVILLTAGYLAESSAGRLGEDFVRGLLERAGEGAKACGRLELALSAASEAREGALPGALLDKLRQAATEALRRKKPASKEASRAALGLALGKVGDPRLGMAKAERWLWFEPGEFTMGSEKMTDEEKPAHRVALSKGFWLGRYPVTNQEYGAFVKAGGYGQKEWWGEESWEKLKEEKWEEPDYWRDGRFNGANQPVVGVSWHEANAYCRWLTEQWSEERPEWAAEGVKIRLPKEAEWEYAARGGTSRAYPWGDEKPDDRRANYDDRLGQTSAVGIYPAGATAEGLWDMAGNVREWCADPWNAKAYQGRKGVTRDPLAKGNPFGRAVRGGSWIITSGGLPAAFRFGNWSWFRISSVGFRVLCAAVAAERD